MRLLTETDATAGMSDSSSVDGAASSVDGATAMRVLDPTSLEFFDLPIGSIRYAVSGRDPQANTCVTAVWSYSNFGMEIVKHCEDFIPGFPYVLITPDTGSPCGQWDYWGNTEFESGQGCVEFADFEGSTANVVDVILNVSGEMFTGAIRITNTE